MRNGSPGHDRRGWQPAQRPYLGQSGPLPEVPYGPDVSWPSGFRRVEFDSGEYRQLVDDYNETGRRPASRYQPSKDDYGYGDPGYADPRYEGPRDRYPTGPMPAVPPVDHVYPVTGAQEVLRDSYRRAPQPDPRLAGLRYDEPRYNKSRLDESRFDESRYEEPRYEQPDEPLSDEAWFAELRRGEPAFPPPVGPAAPVAPGNYRPGPGNAPGYQPGYDRGPGGGQRPAAPSPSPRPGGYRPDGGQRPAGGERPAGGHQGGPRMSAAPYLSAPVGVLIPPAGQRVQAPVRVETAETYWQESRGGGQYSVLVEDLEISAEPSTQSIPVRRGTGGRRRGRSSDHRLWIGLLGVVAVAGGAIFGILKVASPHSSGPAHTLAVPQQIGIYSMDANLAKKVDLNGLVKKFMALGNMKDPSSGALDTGKFVDGLATQNLIVIEGHLPNDDPVASLHAFEKNYRGAVEVLAGPLGGKAACVQIYQGGLPMAMCAWFDNDTVGTVLSSTMQPRDLATQMPGFRSSVEQVASK